MPSRILPACSSPGCPDRSAPGARGRCAKHRIADVQAHDQRRGSSGKRGYGYSWQKLAEWVRQRDGHLCQECLRNGRVTAGRPVDHIVAKAKGGTDDPSNLETLCHECHSRKTVVEDGGLGRTY